MVFRFLSGIGAVAHLADLLLSGATFPKPGPDLKARGARIAGALVVAVILAGCALFAGGVGVEGANNREPTVYTVDQLSGNPDLHGKVYATITATIGADYVDTYKNDSYQYSDYVIGNPDTGNCIIVESKKPEADMEKLIAADGSVTLTGMLRSDSKEVEDALRTLGTKADGLTISKAVLLKEGETPANAEAMFVLTGILAAIAALLFVGWAIRYLVFRPSAAATSPFAAPMTGPIKVHATGLIPGYAHGIRAREMNAVLQVPESPEGAAMSGPGPVDLVWQRKLTVNGVRLTPGTTGVEAGKAYPFRSVRPAIRLKFLRYRLVLSFDSEQDRDAALAQLRASATGGEAI
jgi:hypothetical protein